MKIYLVGGAVRDELLKIKNDDMDYVVVGATPADMRELGYENVGESFPVYLDQTTGDQYALARREKKTGSGYTGFSVDFDPSVTLEEDLWRRDLTINAIAKDITTGEIMDPYGGVQDLQDRILRHVSDAFIEDPLRVIRLARFYARFTNFNLAIETVALAQLVVVSGEMETISPERYWAEIQKMFYQTEEPQRFFSALQLFGVMNNVSFFKNLFGPMNQFYLDNLIAPVAKAAVKFADPVEIFTIAAAQRDAVFNKAPSRIAKGHQMLKKIRELAYDEVVASDMVKLLKMMNAVSRDSELLQDMILVLHLIESTNWAFEWKFRLKSEGLRLAADLAQSVTAQPYMHLEGPAIGRAMDAERTLKIAGIL